jgi:hypothetical protein
MKRPLSPAPSRSGLVPVRWPRSQKLIGYYDPQCGALVYQDAHGRELDRVDLPPSHRADAGKS